MDEASDTRSVLLMLIEKDLYPPFRVDVVELFCNGLAPSGLKIDWFMEAKPGVVGGVFAGKYGQRFVVAGTGGPRWVPPGARRFFNLIGNRCYALWSALFGKYDIVQVRDHPIVSIAYLIAARVAGKKFVFWQSFPMLEGIESNALARRNSLGTFSVLVRIGVARIFQPLFYKIVLSNADHVFVQSERMRDYVKARGVNHDRITPVPMCVCVTKFNPDAIEPTRDPRAVGKIVLVYTGATEPVRRVDEMIRILPLLVRSGFDVVLFIVGGARSDDQSKLASLAEREGIGERVFFTGHLPLEAALSYVRRADICLSPYPTDFIHNTGTPTKIVEYLAMGRPVIANTHPDQSAIIEQSNAGLCVSFSALEFSRAAQTLLSDRTLAERMASNGPAWVSANRSYEAMIPKIFSKYQEIAGIPRRRRQNRPDARAIQASGETK